MRTAIAAVVAALALSLAGCAAGGEGDEGDGGSETEAAAQPPDADGTPDPADESAPAPTPTPEPTRAADGSDVAACYDGDCQVLLSGPTDIEIDGALGITLLSLKEIGPDFVRFEAGGPGISLGCTTPVDNRCALNDVTYHLDDVHEGQALLTFAPK